MCFAKWFGVGKRNKMDIFGRQDLCFMHVQSQDIAFFVGIDVFWSIPIIGRMAGSVSPTSENIHFSTKGWPETCCTSHMVFCIPTGKIEGYLLMKSFPHLWDETVSKCLIFFGGRGSKIRLSIIPNPPPQNTNSQAPLILELQLFISAQIALWSIFFLLSTPMSHEYSR